jgi:hypothetical protein
MASVSKEANQKRFGDGQVKAIHEEIAFDNQEPKSERILHKMMNRKDK